MAAGYFRHRCHIRQILYRINFQHPLQRIGLIAARPFGIVWPNKGLPLSPCHDAVDAFSNLFFLCPSPKQFIAQASRIVWFVHVLNFTIFSDVLHDAVCLRNLFYRIHATGISEDGHTELLKRVVVLFAMGQPLPKNKGHALSGDWVEYPDWLLIDRIEDNVLVLTPERTAIDLTNDFRLAAVWGELDTAVFLCLAFRSVFAHASAQGALRLYQKICAK